MNRYFDTARNALKSFFAADFPCWTDYLHGKPSR